ncbi:MAG: SRPBCC family protein [Erythrobacter sp.]|uniref:SRPBCC family protein n=1 Tax=Erythrobacter sp. TaxID=1042 RepID=UPI002B48B9D2|nr:SRPBCC family protein [Erythrobacter sp.]WRH71594.1 MAG: SRPBCC family protein [Erythrobacter sp.]
MTEPDQEPLPYHTNMRGQRAGSGFLLTMLGLLLLTILLLNTGVLEASYSGIAFMGLLPFVIGALVTGAGLQVYSHYGCIIAPVLLFAIMFPLVHYGLAEGLICIIMVLPFWLAAGIGGALATYVIHRRQRRLEREEGVTRFQALGLAALPFALLYAEEASPPAWEEHAVVRHVDIAADARDVWPLLLSIPAVSSDEGIVTFTHDIAGIPRPAEARLVQRGEQLVRVGRWGDAIRFEERVTALEPGHRIAWDFAFPDNSVQTYTDRHISPDGPLLKIARGGYTLQPLGDGRVRVTLSTTYRMRSRLDWYLAAWGERMLGDVEANVLAIIKARAER